MTLRAKPKDGPLLTAYENGYRDGMLDGAEAADANRRQQIANQVEAITRLLALVALLEETMTSENYAASVAARQEDDYSRTVSAAVGELRAAVADLSEYVTTSTNDDGLSTRLDRVLAALLTPGQRQGE